MQKLKIKPSIWFVIITIITAFGCESNLENVDTNEGYFANVLCELHTWDSGLSQRVTTIGNLYSQNSIDLNYYSVNGNKMFRHDEEINLSLSFYENCYDTVQNNNIDFSNIIFEVSTSLGNLTSPLMYFPDAVTNIRLEAEEPVYVGDSVVIKWDCEDADYYYLHFNYGFYEYDFITTRKEFLVTSDILNRQGEFGDSYSIIVKPCNGKIPGNNTSPNLSGGNGNYGYIISSSGSTYNEGEAITIWGDNKNISGKEKVSKPIEKNEHKIRKDIISRRFFSLLSSDKFLNKIVE